jgi:hypothetical protein
MLSWKIFVKAERLRQALGERHFGHFDRDAVFLHGAVQNEAEAMPAVEAEAPTGTAISGVARCTISCRIQPDTSSGNLRPKVMVV